MRLRFWPHEAGAHATRSEAQATRSSAQATRSEALRAMRAIRRANRRNAAPDHNDSDSPNDLWYAMQMPTG